MANKFKSIVIVSLSTVGSRVLGLFRDILTFSVFGTSALNSAFIYAFTFPNLFRRLLGEGALTAAMLPILTEEHEAGGNKALFFLYNKVLSRLITVLFAFTLLSVLVLIAVGKIPGLNERWELATYFGVILFPYMLFICLAAAFSAILNVLHRFAIPALTAVWLNLSIIGMLGGIGIWKTDDALGRMYWLCGGVLLGGLLQLIIPWFALRREGWKLELDFVPNAQVQRVVKLLIPGIIGASVIQLNIVVSRSLAHFIDESAVSLLYLANRLVELPLGIFSIAIATVYFPVLSKWVAQKNTDEFADCFRQGLRMILAITVPAMVGLIVLGESILGFLFEWGMFGAGDTERTLPILWIFALGLPLYSVVAFLLRGFYAHKDTKSPMHVAIFSFAVNLILSLALMWKMGVIGLAIANVMGILAQTVFLSGLLCSKLGKNLFSGILFEGLKAIGASIGMILFIYFLHFALSYTNLAGKASAALDVFVTIPLAVVVYLVGLWVFRFKDFEELKAMGLRLLKKDKDC